MATMNVVSVCRQIAYNCGVAILLMNVDRRQQSQSRACYMNGVNTLMQKVYMDSFVFKSIIPKSVVQDRSVYGQLTSERWASYEILPCEKFISPDREASG